MTVNDSLCLGGWSNEYSLMKRSALEAVVGVGVLVGEGVRPRVVVGVAVAVVGDAEILGSKRGVGERTTSGAGVGFSF